jgi:hypothetical protein
MDPFWHSSTYLVFLDGRFPERAGEWPSFVLRVQSDDLRLAGGNADVGGSHLRLRRRDAAADVELDRTESLLVALDRRADGRQEPFGRVKVHDDPLNRLDVLAAGCERLHIQPKVEDDFLGRGGYPTEVGV